MKRQTPPIDSIEAFLQAAQSQSFREAADALALSPSAFSRRVQALEAFLGATLFDRSGPRPELNEVGRQYLKAVGPAIETIRRASLPTNVLDRARPLRVMAPHSFTISWLALRLPTFIAQANGSEVELTISRDLAPLRMGSADIAFVSGPRDWKDLAVDLLAPLTGILACAPVLIGGKPAPKQLSDLAQHRLLGVTWPRDLWSAWLSGVDYRGPPLGDPTLYDTASLLYEAAAAGFGVAIAVPFLSERLLQSGRLRRVGRERAPLGVDYYLVCASERVSRRADVRAFSAWARGEAEATLKAFESVA